jgi:hypothetical protein
MTKKKKHYQFAIGAVYKCGDPELVVDELERIRKERGQLTKEVVVEEATPKRAILHDEFEWDDTEAAKKYRLQQASYIIKNVRVIMPNNEPVRQYVSVTSGDDRIYESIDVVMKDPDYRQEALEQVMDYLTAAQRKLQAFQDLMEQVTAVSKAIEVVAKAIRPAAIASAQPAA